MPHFIVHQAVNFQRLMEGRLVSSFSRQTSSADKFEGKKKKRDCWEGNCTHQHQMVYMLLTSWHLVNGFSHWPSAQLNQKHSYNFILYLSKSAPKHHPGSSQGQNPNISKHREEKCIRELEKIQASTIYPIGNLQSWGQTTDCLGGTQDLLQLALNYAQHQLLRDAGSWKGLPIKNSWDTLIKKINK